MDGGMKPGVAGPAPLARKAPNARPWMAGPDAPEPGCAGPSPQPLCRWERGFLPPLQFFLPPLQFLMSCGNFP